jgi:hypothetical protein
MNDPHVEHLSFTAEPLGNISYRDPPPVDVTLPVGSLRLESGILTVHPSVHFATEAEAKKAVEPYLRSWEIDSDLRWGVGTLRFKFTDSLIIDRNPPPPGSHQVISANAAVVLVTAGQGSIHVTRATYPEPPVRFLATKEVEILVHRFTEHMAGREPLTGMAYFSLTVVQALAGGRKEAASRFALDVRILSRIGELSSSGDHRTARKIQKGKPLRALTSAEENWLREAVKLLIRRVGEEASGAGLTRLPLSALPHV